METPRIPIPPEFLKGFPDLLTLKDFLISKGIPPSDLFIGDWTPPQGSNLETFYHLALYVRDDAQGRVRLSYMAYHGCMCQALLRVEGIHFLKERGII